MGKTQVREEGFSPLYIDVPLYKCVYFLTQSLEKRGGGGKGCQHRLHLRVTTKHYEPEWLSGSTCHWMSSILTISGSIPGPYGFPGSKAQRGCDIGSVGRPECQDNECS
jgi:hypothetical protein